MTSLEITPTGVSSTRARRLKARGRIPPRASRSSAGGARARPITIPNEILLSLGVLEIMFGSCRDALFLGILVSNIAVGGFGRDRRSVTDVLVEGCW